MQEEEGESRTGRGRDEESGEVIGGRESEGDENRILGTAASSPDVRKLHLLEASDEAKRHKASEVDAMGKDKRREVVGHSYGPTRKSQIMFFVIVGVVLVVIIGGWTLAVAAFDKGPGDNPPEVAPWSAEDAPQAPAVRPQ